MLSFTGKDASDMKDLCTTEGCVSYGRSQLVPNNLNLKISHAFDLDSSCPIIKFMESMEYQ